MRLKVWKIFPDELSAKEYIVFEKRSDPSADVLLKAYLAPVNEFNQFDETSQVKKWVVSGEIFY